MASVYVIARRCSLGIADMMHTPPGVLLDMLEIMHPHKENNDFGEEDE